VGYLGNKTVIINFKTPSCEFTLSSAISIEAFKKQDGGVGIGWIDPNQDRDMWQALVNAAIILWVPNTM
jgi:frataxin-like iron-binding protein CyaY